MWSVDKSRDRVVYFLHERKLQVLKESITKIKSSITVTFEDQCKEQTRKSLEQMK